MAEKPQTMTGIARIMAAFSYSFSGLRYAFRNEAAFRQEIALYIVLLIGLLLLPISLTFKTILFFANTMVLIIELLNSAIESVVDLASPEYHELAKGAKDIGSAAVLLCLLMVVVLWGLAIYSAFW